jgi:hypothetical protein
MVTRMPVQLLILASSPRGGAAVVLESGALVRTHWSVPAPTFPPYEIVEADEVDDEALAFAADSLVARNPVSIGHLRGRKVEKLIKPLVHPGNSPLLGAAAPTLPYWTIRSDQPSVAIVSPSDGPVVERDWSSKLRCRFRWRRMDHDLPLDDPALEERLSHPTATRLAGNTLSRALGWKPQRLLVALTPPRDGVCHKVVAGLLPRP